jgi:hypothetical protein
VDPIHQIRDFESPDRPRRRLQFLFHQGSTKTFIVLILWDGNETTTERPASVDAARARWTEVQAAWVTDGYVEVPRS